MSGKFVNTTHKETIDTLIYGLQDIIKNPYYKWQNKTPTPVTYFNHNVEKSTLDEGSKLEQIGYGHNSPTVYNKINGFYIYGLETVQVQIENGEFGAQASPITGEGVILPNTITPYQGDYFIIDYTKDDIVFQVTGVSHDTLENGANIYKITYELDTIDVKDLELNIGDSYQMMINNEGTKFNTIIRSESYEFIKKLDSVRSYLKDHFIELFYSSRIQSFSFLFNMRRFYDPYMIEFLINNKILDDVEDFIYVSHQLPLNQSFGIDYSRSIFKCFEDEDFKNIAMYQYKAIGRFIDSPTSIFGNRPEQYWKVDFKFTDLEGNMFGILPCFKDEFIPSIIEDELFDDENSIYNIIIKFIHNHSLTDEDIDQLKYLEYMNNPILFYTIPLIIFCLDRIISRLMIKNDK